MTKHRVRTLSGLELKFSQVAHVWCEQRLPWAQAHPLEVLLVKTMGPSQWALEGRVLCQRENQVERTWVKMHGSPRKCCSLWGRGLGETFQFLSV